MQVRVTLGRPGDNQEKYFLEIFINVSIDVIEDLLYRRPDYIIRGKNKQTITFYGLSESEAKIVKDTYAKEMDPDGYGIVTRVIMIKSRMEEDTSVYTFARPEYAPGFKEGLEEKNGYMVKKIETGSIKTKVERADKNLDISYFVGSAMRTAYRVAYRMVVDEDDEDKPLSNLAFDMGDYFGLFEPDGSDKEALMDYITEEIANEPMYKEHKRKPRAPRKPRNRSTRKKTASHPHKTKTGNPPL